MDLLAWVRAYRRQKLNKLALNQAKRITVKPGAKLSVQMHHQRAEHWVVVSGSVEVTKGDKTFLLSENESTYISIGMLHASENIGKVPLEIIEIQSGSLFEEDDILRFEDRYGCAKDFLHQSQGVAFYADKLWMKLKPYE